MQWRSGKMSSSLMMMVMVMTAAGKSGSDYCRISSKHTMCRYKGISSECRGHNERKETLEINDQQSF